MRDPSSDPIPVPLSRRGQLFLARFTPLLVFIVAAAICTQLWHARIEAPTFIATVEQRTALVRAPVDGQLLVVPGLSSLQSVAAGEVIGWIQPMSASLAEAELTMLRRELEALQINPAVGLDLKRVGLESARLQIEWMQARVDLAELQAELRAARDTVKRFDELRPTGFVDEQSDELARTDMEGLEARVAAQAATVARLAPDMDRLGEVADMPSAPAAIQAQLNAQKARLDALELRLAPQPLTAPFDGVVLDYRPAGEQLLGGDIVATIGASEATRIVGYERQPGTLAAVSGDQFIITSRRLPGQNATSTLLEVSPTLEPVPAEILAMWRSTLPESGRRFQFSLPEDLPLIPGEQVEVTPIVN